jgi:membrane-bound metal-dependent hydrolase YbcI (DUF457 family)
MVLPGHLAGGYLTATALLAVFHPDLSMAQTNALLVIGTLAGELPDIDLFFFNIRHRRDRNEPRHIQDTDNHRNYITHVPFFWFIVSATISFVGFISSTFIEWIGFILLAGTLSHFILDSVEYGIRWFAPWSNKRFAIQLQVPEKTTDDRPGSIKQYFHFLIHTYWKMKTFWLEIIVTIVAICILAQRL